MVTAGVFKLRGNLSLGANVGEMRGEVRGNCRESPDLVEAGHDGNVPRHFPGRWLGIILKRVGCRFVSIFPELGEEM